MLTCANDQAAQVVTMANCVQLAVVTSRAEIYPADGAHTNQDIGASRTLDDGTLLTGTLGLTDQNHTTVILAAIAQFPPRNPHRAQIS